MSTPPLDWIALSGAKPKGKRPQFLADPAVERVLAITMVLAQELHVTRERLDTVERLLAERGLLERAALETYAPDPAAALERAEAGRAYLARVLRYLQQEIEALQNPDDNYDVATKADELRNESP
jgi:hypothetical protein